MLILVLTYGRIFDRLVGPENEDQAFSTLVVVRRNEQTLGDEKMCINLEALSPATLIALAKVFTKAAEEKSIQVGKHKLKETVTLTIDGMVTRSKDVDYTPTTSIPKGLH